MNRARSRILWMAIVAALASQFASAVDESGWYVGANIGRSISKINGTTISNDLQAAGVTTTSIADSNRDTGYELLGGYQVSPYFAIEGGYFDLGKFDFSASTVPAGALNGNIKIRGTNLDAVGVLPLTDSLSAFARGGAIYTQAKDQFNSSGSINTFSSNPSKRAGGFKFGAGLQYAFNEAVDIRVQAERYRVDDALGNRGNIDLLSVGLIYRFGEKPVALPTRPSATAPESTPTPEVVALDTPAAPVRVTLNADMLFDFDGATIRPEGHVALDAFVEKIKSINPTDMIMGVGYADRLGSQTYNQRLSEERVEAVKAYLVGRGIKADRIHTEGRGKTEPVTKVGECSGAKSAAVIACLQPDRRVEVDVQGNTIVKKLND